MPSASPAEKVVESEEAVSAQGETNAPAPQQPQLGAHTVTSYTRRDPNKSDADDFKAEPDYIEGVVDSRDTDQLVRESATGQKIEPMPLNVGDEGTEEERRERVGDVPDTLEANEERARLKGLHDNKECNPSSCPFCNEDCMDATSDAPRGDERVAPYAGEEPDELTKHTTTTPESAARNLRKVEEPEIQGSIEPPYPSEASAEYVPEIGNMDTKLAPAIGARGFEFDEDHFDIIERRKGGWVVLSEDGSKHLGGPYASKEEAVKRLREVDYFKAHPEK